MSEPRLHLYFAYGSSYSYLAWHRVRSHPERYARAEVLWHPVQFGELARLQQTSGETSRNQDAYARLDVARWAAHYGAPMRYPPSYPIDSSDCARAHLLAEMEGPVVEAAFMDALFRAHWEQGRDISDRRELERIAAAVGLVPLGGRLDAPGTQKLLDANTRDAFGRGAPGLPYAVLELDGSSQGFWGNDRLAWVEAALAGTAPAV